MSYPNRCVSACQINSALIKRCIRAIGHAEPHLWLESTDRSDGLPALVEWTGAGDVNSPTRRGNVALNQARSPSDRPTVPVEALVHDLQNMLSLYQSGRATAENVAFALDGILDNYRLQVNRPIQNGDQSPVSA